MYSVCTSSLLLGLFQADSDYKLCWGFAHLAALGLVSMMLHYVIVKTVVSVGLIGMHKTGCSEETRLVLLIMS